MTLVDFVAWQRAPPLDGGTKNARGGVDSLLSMHLRYHWKAH